MDRPKTGHFDRVGIEVICAVCRQRKNPIGRSAPMQWGGCGWECPGYREAPYVGSLWPGESAREFGYPAGSDGTKIVWVGYPAEDDD